MWILDSCNNVKYLLFYHIYLNQIFIYIFMIFFLQFNINLSQVKYYFYFYLPIFSKYSSFLFLPLYLSNIFHPLDTILSFAYNTIIITPLNKKMNVFSFLFLYKTIFSHRISRNDSSTQTNPILNSHTVP